MRRDEFIQIALDKKASDIHIAPNAYPMLHVNGMLKAIEGSEIMSREQVFEAVKEICDVEQLEKLEQAGELNFSFSIKEYGRFRVNIIKQRGTFSLSIRILKLIIPTKESLSLPDVVYDLAEQGKGLFVVSGAAGSGRSTTMASILQHLNETQRLNIITVESPIEYLFKHGESIVLQRDVGIDCESTAQGVKSIMRHDPDVVMISDISDDNVLELALQIAESGKLVIAGQSSINAVSAIESMIALSKPERVQNRKLKVAFNILGIISQQLVPGKSEDRVLAYEMLLPNAAIRSHIISGNFSEVRNSLAVGRKQGMVTMDQNLYECYLKGDITQDTLYKYCLDLEYVKRLERTSHKGELS